MDSVILCAFNNYSLLAVSSALLGMLLVIFITLLLMLIQKTQADRRKLSRDEYKFEVWVKEPEKPTNFTPKKVKEPKLRHGKKNKEKNRNK